MEYGLPAVGAGVRDEPIASLVDPFLLGEFARNREKMTCELLIFRFQRGDRVNVLVRHDQNVGWRDGMSIPKSRHLFIVVKNSRFRFSGNDLTENA